ncbi:hypothetical protein Ndes2526B_g06596 [Nannochloris sp. 'desiccata']|nr:putative Alkane 1-monooxygenase 2 [Chlorella desiccata (nom. nud.)]
MKSIQTGSRKFITSGTALGSTRPRSSIHVSPVARNSPSPRSPINRGFSSSLSNATTGNLRANNFSSTAARAASSQSSSNISSDEHNKDSNHPHETSDGNSNDTTTPLSDNWLGVVFLRLLPGYLFYAPSFIMPIVTTAAAIGAIWGCQIVAAAATLPVIRSITPLSAALTALGTQQPWTTLSTIALSLMTAWYAFGVIPILDWILGRELRNPTAEQAQVAADDGLYRSVLYAYVAIHLTVLFVVGHFLCTNPSVSALGFIGAAISYGVSNGIGFTVAHELLHGRSWMEKTAANLLLAPLCYMHWTKSHLMHHVKVATPEDPSSARKGESLWSFIPRSIIGNVKDGYGGEAARRRAKKIPFWDTRNRALWWAGSPMLLGALATSVYGLKGLAFLSLQAGVGILMLEIVNYIEHYGLARKKISNGRYERVEPRHSWNATTIYTNAVSFRLQRHSDHHAHEDVHYQLLKDIREAPQLPAGYPAMMLLSTVPPLYFKVMNPRVEEAEAAAAALGA